VSATRPATGLGPSTRIEPARWSFGRRVKNHAIFVVVWISLVLVRPFPRAVLVVLGRALGLLAWIVARGPRTVALENLARVFPDRSARERRLLARRSFVELGALLGDGLVLLRKNEIPSRSLSFPPDAREVLASALASGRGVVLVTAHLGSWERLAGCLVEAGHALTTPVRASYDPRLDRLVHAPLRRGHGVNAIDREAPSTPRALLRALRDGGIAGFLVDLNTRVDSVRVPFLGHEAWTVVAPARIALRTGAPIVCAIAGRDGVRVELVREASSPRSGRIDDEAQTLTATIAEHVSRAILREPERWIWMHDRFGARPTERRDKRHEGTSDP